MTQVFKRFGQILAFAIAVLVWTDAPIQANPRAWYGGYYPGYYGAYGYYPYSTWYGSYPYYTGYGYSPYSMGYGSYPYYTGYGYYPSYGYSVGYPVYSPSGIASSPAVTTPTTTSFYQDSSSANPAFYSETGLRSDKSTPTDRTARIRVIVPDPNTDVVVDGMKTAALGVVREFRSPALEDGSYTYEIRAIWTDNGQTKTKTEKVKVTPGSWKIVNFPDSIAK